MPVRPCGVCNPHRPQSCCGPGARWGIGALHPLTARALGLQTPVYLFELDLGFLSRRELPVLPAAVQVPARAARPQPLGDRETPAAAVLECIAGQAGKVLQEARLFDLYCGERLDTAEKHCHRLDLTRHF